jgi:hypothetical protein
VDADFGCHFFRSGVAAGVGCVSVGFRVSGCLISWAEDWVGVFSVAGVVDFGCHFLRSGAGGGGLVVVAERF